MRLSVSRVIPEFPVVFTPSGTTSQTGTVKLSMSIPVGVSHFESVHREHTTPQRQLLSGFCLIKAERGKGDLVVFVLGIGLATCVPDVGRHLVILINPVVSVYRPRAAGLIIRNSYNLENTCVLGTAKLISTSISTKKKTMKGFRIL